MCCDIFCKYVCFATLCFAIFLFGLGIETITAWILFEPGVNLSTNDEVHFFYGVQILLLIGLLITLIGFLGFTAVLKRSQQLIVSLFVIVLFVVAVQISAAVWLYYNPQDVEKFVTDSVKSAIQLQYGVSDSITTTYDAIQTAIKCCGASNSRDWQESEFNKVNRSKIILTVTNIIPMYKIPKSCCVLGISDEDCMSVTKISSLAYISNDIYSEGCVEKVFRMFRDDPLVTYKIGAIVGTIEFILLLFSFVFSFTFKKKRNFSNTNPLKA